MSKTVVLKMPGLILTICPLSKLDDLKMPRLVIRLFPHLDFAKGELFPEVEAHCLLLLMEKVRIVVIVTRTTTIMELHSK